MYGAYKARATAVNVNYRYVEDELRYVLDNAGAHDDRLPVDLRAAARRRPRPPAAAAPPDPDPRRLGRGAPPRRRRVGGVPRRRVRGAARPALHRRRSLRALHRRDDGHAEGRPLAPRGRLLQRTRRQHSRLRPHRHRTTSSASTWPWGSAGARSSPCPSCTAPGSGRRSTRSTAAARSSSRRRRDASTRTAVWRTVERHKPEQIMIVGDAFARPLLAALEEHRYDVSSIRVVTSTAAVLSKTVKDELHGASCPTPMLLESVGGSELGLQAMSYDTDSGQAGIPAYQLRDNTVLLTEDLSAHHSARAATGLGWIASTGHLPLGYLGDEAKTRRTFPVIDGVRHAVGGDRGALPAGRSRPLPRPRVRLHQHRRREGLRRGGRAHRQEPPGDLRRAGRRHEGRALGPAGHRRRVPQAGADARPTSAALRAHCAAHLADYKIPTRDRRRPRDRAQPERQARLCLGRVVRRRKTAIGDSTMRTPICDLLGIELPDLRLHPLPRRRRRGLQGRRLRRPRRRRLPARAARGRAQVDRRARRRPALRRRHRHPRQVRGHGRGRPEEARGDAAGGDPAAAPPASSTRSSPSTACRSCPRARSRSSELLGWTAATATPQVDVALRHPKVRLIANALGTPPPESSTQIHDSGRLVAALCGAAKQARVAQGRGRRHHHRAGLRGRRSHRRRSAASCCGPR